MQYQIDVLTSHSDGLHSYSTAIECKYRKDKVSWGQVAKLAVAIDDAGIQKGVVVSKSGFTRSARLVADFKGISLVQLRRPRPSDWDGYVAGVSIDLNLVVDEIYDYSSTIKGVTENRQKDFRLADIELQVNVGGDETKSFREIADHIRNHRVPMQGVIGKARWSRVSPLEDQVADYVVSFPGGTAIIEPRTECEGELKELRFKIGERVLSERIRIDHTDYVSWILEAVFEDKLFAISADGIPSAW